ncbi:MAG: SPL family radical SAM protein [Anaerolineae bacterium]
MRHGPRQLGLFGDTGSAPSLPVDYQPVPPSHFAVSRIFLAKGSIATPARRRFVERICAVYPEAEVEDRLDTPHNRVELGESDALALHATGKRTLVFGELGQAVRFSQEEGNACPNYWHFSPYGFCPYGCKYCYLAGTTGVRLSPTVKVFVNLPEMLGEVDGIARRQGKPTAFYVGKLQDALALEPLTAYSEVLVPFFARHPFARLTLLTKSSDLGRLLQFEHEGHTVLSWSVNPPEVCAAFEEHTPSIEERLEAMRRAAQSGYPVRAVMMPIIPIDNWQEIYASFTRRLLESVPIQRLTLGGICIYRGARLLMERKVGRGNPVSASIGDDRERAGDGRSRYPRPLRCEAYSTIIRAARHIRADLELALCLEEKAVWQSMGLERRLGRCNCVL